MHSQQPFDLEYALVRVRAAWAASQVRQKFHQLRRKAGFNPAQPRVPAGRPDGGQWSDDDGSATPKAPAPDVASRSSNGLSHSTVVDQSGRKPWRSFTEQRRADGSPAALTVTNRDGSYIETAFSDSRGVRRERSSVTLPDGTKFTFETDGDVQRMFDGKVRLVGHTVWTSSGPEPQPMVQSASIATILEARRIMEAGRLLYNSAVEFGDYLGAVLSFRAWDHNRDNAEAELTFSGNIDRETVAEFCRELDTVQGLTDEAARLAGDRSAYSSAAAYGTAVHARLRDMIRELGNPRLRAEISLMKRQEEDPSRLGSIRIDVVESGDDGTVCVYDIKTGKRGLSSSRISEFVGRLRDSMQSPNQVIVIEIRPFE